MPIAAASAPAAPAPAPPVAVRPEVLAPAGDWTCVRAAVENGADAVYFGLERFNARMRAKNLTQADLPELMAFLHARGVRGYVTFNILVFPDELAEAADYVRTMVAAGVDAAIVQDVGACRLIRALSPDFPIHCSTQMTITSAAGVDFARELGAQLVVLARENSLSDIAQIQAAQAAAPRRLPLEVFVHGALCVAYSGQCLTSEALGQRSANRGECAQACRLPYDLIADGKPVDLGQRRYLLSPQDLAGLDVLPELIRLGVASLKIEGRLKSPEYVAGITRVYREAVDRLLPLAVRPGAADAAGGALADLHRAHDYAMAMAFSRGLYPGWFRGTDNQALVHANFGTKRGVFLGAVTAVGPDRVSLRLVAPLKPGDGIVFDAGHPEDGEEGGRVYQVEPRGAESSLRFGRGDIDFRRVHAGDRVWKTSDPALERRIRRTFEGEAVRFRRPVTMEVHGHAGAPLTLIANDGLGHVVRRESAVALAAARTQPLSPERLRAHLGRLGGSPLELGELRSQLEGGVMLPLSELNRLRREVAEELVRLRAQPPRWTLEPSPVGASLPIRLAQGPEPVEGLAKDPATGDACSTAEVASPFDKLRAPSPSRGKEAPASAGEPELIAVVRTLDQLEAAWAADVRTIYCEFEDPKRYRDAVRSFRELQRAAGGDRLPDVADHEAPGANRKSKVENQKSSIWVAPPRVFKPGEDWILRQVASCEPDGFLVRNFDHLACYRGRRLRGDYSLNVANPLAADYFLRRYGLERVTASYDLNIQQLEALLRAAPPAWFEITIHQHMPLFHMEHCVFCAFLTAGHDYRDCGRPCDRTDLRLRDRVGAALPVRADAGCRNTVFNTRAQTGAEYLPRLVALGARAFRVEFLDEAPADLAGIVRRYRQVLRGEITGAELWREFRLIHELGVTRGTLDEGVSSAVTPAGR